MKKDTKWVVPAGSLFVLCCQGLPADLFGFVIIFLRGLRVGLHMSAVEAAKKMEHGEMRIRAPARLGLAVFKTWLSRLVQEAEVKKQKTKQPTPRLFLPPLAPKISSTVFQTHMYLHTHT